LSEMERTFSTKTNGLFLSSFPSLISHRLFISHLRLFISTHIPLLESTHSLSHHFFVSFRCSVLSYSPIVLHHTYIHALPSSATSRVRVCHEPAKNWHHFLKSCLLIAWQVRSKLLIYFFTLPNSFLTLVVLYTHLPSTHRIFIHTYSPLLIHPAPLVLVIFMAFLPSVPSNNKGLFGNK